MSLVIIPTYNELENVEAIIRAVFALSEPFHVLIVDDGSPDGTAQIVKNLQASEFQGRLHLLERAGKLGLGTAYIAGFRWGLERGYEYFFEMDADFSHNPNDLPRLLDKCRNEGADVAVGSRYCKGGHLENWPADRIILSRGASLYASLILWMPVADPTAGFICYRRKVLETMAEGGLERGKEGLEVYCMAELPSNFLQAEDFAKLFDGFSIGSNDLTQLILGVDRDSAMVAPLFNERNAGVKEACSRIIRIGHEQGIKVGICGQAPSDYLDFALFLVEQKIDSISLTPDAVLRTLQKVSELEQLTPAGWG